MVAYDDIADALLGTGMRPFASGTAATPASFWYTKSAFSSTHRDLAAALVRAAGSSYIVEVGSFIGNSAITWANAIKRERSASKVVCIDTWLGDVGMWQQKGKWLGPRDGTGQPRIFEQFLANVLAANASELVLPLRAPSSVGLRYLATLVATHRVPPPMVVYLDAAHEYPETELEVGCAHT